jgi:DNA-binding NarL/FixJ family response regulator
MAGPRAVVADTQAVTRIGIRRALEHAGVAVVAEAGDAAGAVAAVRRRRPELCFVDARLRGGGIAAASEIASCSPATSVIVLSEQGSEDELLAALRGGAKGYLPKDVGPAGLARAARAALDGEAPLPRALTARLVEELRFRHGGRRLRDAGGAWVTLSARESEVLELLRRDLTTKQIAERLGISAVTVRRHVSDALRRLGVRDRDAALRITA